jgi:hypothetical protein
MPPKKATSARRKALWGLFLFASAYTHSVDADEEEQQEDAGFGRHTRYWPLTGQRAGTRR